MLDCQTVLRELSQHVRSGMNSGLPKEVELHLQRCRQCSVVLNTAKESLVIYSRESVVEVPAQYSQRLRNYFLKKLEKFAS